MKDTDDMLEILIGKYIDGEISPTEQYMLDERLQSDSQAKELFEQLQDLHRRSQEVIGSEVLDSGKDAQEIFERAWQQTKRPLRRVIYMSSRLRFAVGLAAGLIIGLTLHFALFAQLTNKGSEAPAKQVAKNYQAPVTQVAQDTSSITDPDRPIGGSSMPDSSENVIRNVDWYSFTDEDGQQWLIERVRQNVVRPAVYQEGL